MQTPARSDTRLGRLARFCYARRKLVLILWIVGLVAVSVMSQAVGPKYTFKFSSSSESGRAQTLLASRFPAAAGDTAYVVFNTTDPVTSPANAGTIGQLAAKLATLAHVTGVTSPLTQAGASQVDRDGHIGYAVVQFDKTSSYLPKDAIQKVIDASLATVHPGFEVELAGPPIDIVEFAVPGAATGIGVAAAIVILLFAFGSVVAMGLPLVIALMGLGISVGFIAVLSHFASTPNFAPDLAAMIGLGVGVDYALFIVTRYREGLRDGLDPKDATVLALTTSGKAVLFAGTTVVISLLGLLLMGQPFVVGLAFGSIFAVLMVLLGTVTLLPALLGFAGFKIVGRRQRKSPQAGPPTERTLAWRWSREIQRRSWPAAILSLAVLVVLAIPLFSMRQAFTDDGNAAANLTTRKAYDLLAQGFGPGYNGPLVVAVDLGTSGDTAVVPRLQQAIAADTSDLVFVAPARPNQAQDTFAITAIPRYSPQDARTVAAVQHLRNDVIPPVVQGTGVNVLVGGFTAASIDGAQSFSARLPLVIGLVVALSFLLLMCVFRSVVVPLKAAVMNLLSIGAAYGVVVAVFQWGWLGSVIGIGKTGPIDPWVPLFLFTILFGLSMDYEVFLLSRIREEWLRTGDNANSVADGLAATARVITAAAAIMVCVFLSFVIKDPIRVLKLFGLGLASAILVDASIVRMVLVPSTMELLGNANWWLPKWLDRILPKVNVEGESETLEPEPAVAP